jgi:hypothetical protein
MSKQQLYSAARARHFSVPDLRHFSLRAQFYKRVLKVSAHSARQNIDVRFHRQSLWALRFDLHLFTRSANP